MVSESFSCFSAPNCAGCREYTFISTWIMQTKWRIPIARRKFSMSASVFFTSAEYISLPTIGQKGTFVPSSWLTASASAVFPVPGPPASSTARPDIFFPLTRSTTRPHAYHVVSNCFDLAHGR